MKIGRNAGNGRFTTVKEAIKKPNTHIVETIRPQPTSNTPNKGK